MEQCRFVIFTDSHRMRPKGSGTRLREESLVKKHGWRKLSQGQWESLGHCLKQWGWGVVVPYSQNNARVWAWRQTLAIHNLRRQENFELEDSMGYLERLQDQKGCWGENEEGKLFKPLRDAFPGNTTDMCVCVSVQSKELRPLGQYGDHAFI